MEGTCVRGSRGQRESRMPGPGMNPQLHLIVSWIHLVDDRVGVGMGSVGLGAGSLPGHEALQGPVADHGAPGITLWRRGRHRGDACGGGGGGSHR